MWWHHSLCDTYPQTVSLCWIVCFPLLCAFSDFQPFAHVPVFPSVNSSFQDGATVTYFQAQFILLLFTHFHFTSWTHLFSASICWIARFYIVVACWISTCFCSFGNLFACSHPEMFVLSASLCISHDLKIVFTLREQRLRHNLQCSVTLRSDNLTQRCWELPEKPREEKNNSVVGARQQLSSAGGKVYKSVLSFRETTKLFACLF